MKTATRFTALLLGLSMLMPAVSFAETATSTNAITQLKQRILELQVQILELQKQQQQVTLELLKTLQQGANGDDVKTLQMFLAGDSEIYPEGKVTGFFGPMTAKAVKKFQKKHGLEQVGFVGKKTLKKLNELFKERGAMGMNDDWRNFASSTTSTSTPPCGPVPPGHLIAPGWLKKMDREHENGKKEREGDDNENGEHGDRGNKFGLNLPCGQGTTTPPVVDTTAPTISNVAVGSITQTGATITWTTSEPTVAKMAYGTTTSYAVETGFSLSSSSGFTQVLSGLTASTTYHFKITVKDAAGNMASTSDMAFTTASVPVADTTVPVISSISTGSIASTTAMVTWATNELATSKVYYGTTTPLSLSGASFIADGTLVTSHTKTLSGLMASTTHYYVVESQDGAGNIATSTQNSFITLP